MESMGAALPNCCAESPEFNGKRLTMHTELADLIGRLRRDNRSNIRADSALGVCGSALASDGISPCVVAFGSAALTGPHLKSALAVL